MNWFGELTRGLKHDIYDKNPNREKEYINAFNSAIEIILSTSVGKELIRNWKALPNKPLMIKSNNATFNFSTKDEIEWNSNRILVLTDKKGNVIGKASAVSILFHEAVHLTDKNLLENIDHPYPGLESSFDVTKAKGKNPVNYAEYIAVTKTNQFREELRQQLRINYLTINSNIPNTLTSAERAPLEDKYIGGKAGVGTSIEYLPNNNGENVTIIKDVKINNGIKEFIVVKNTKDNQDNTLVKNIVIERVNHDDIIERVTRIEDNQNNIGTNIFEDYKLGYKKPLY